MEDNLPKYYTIPEVCRELGKSQRQVWRYIREYEPEYALRAVPIGGRIVVIFDSDLRNFLQRVKNRPDNRGQYDRSKRAPRKKKSAK